MTKRRLAVTSRSAAFSSPRCTRRASLRSSAGSLMRGSFWMSCRYWSNAPEGLARKKALALPPLDRTMLGLRTVKTYVEPVENSSNGAQYRNRRRMVQIYPFFQITNCYCVAGLPRLSTIHITCGEIDVDGALTLSCTPCGDVQSHVGSC